MNDDVRVVAFEQLLQVRDRLAEVLDGNAVGVPYETFEVLRAIASADGGGIRLSELADRVGLSKSGLTRRLDRMEQEGLVLREVCADDRRGATASLTPLGRTAYERAVPEYQEAVRRHFTSKMTEGEAKQLSALMKRILGGVEVSVRNRVELR